jgi:hypothetical protein
LESAGSQKERKTEANLEEDHYGRSRDMWQNMEPGKRLAGQQSQMEILHKCVMFLTEQTDELLLLLLHYTLIMNIKYHSLSWFHNKKDNEHQLKAKLCN